MKLARREQRTRFAERPMAGARLGSAFIQPDQRVNMRNEEETANVRGLHGSSRVPPSVRIALDRSQCS